MDRLANSFEETNGYWTRASNSPPWLRRWVSPQNSSAASTPNSNAGTAARRATASVPTSLNGEIWLGVVSLGGFIWVEWRRRSRSSREGNSLPGLPDPRVWHEGPQKALHRPSDS